MTAGISRMRRSVRCAVAVVVAMTAVVPVFASAAPVSAAGFRPLAAGSNADGQLGDGTRTARATLAGVGVTNIEAIASGRATTYAIDNQSRLWAWGDNSNGQIGDGTTIDRATPVMVLTDVSEIAAGDEHVIVQRGDEGHEIWTWGSGALGQLGLGTTTRRLRPTRVPGFYEPIQIAAGKASSYVLEQWGTVSAFGDNAQGQLGDGTTTRRLTPVEVVGLSTVDAIGAGGRMAMAVRGDGVFYTWGSNEYGQLGDGTTVNKSAPVRIADDVYQFDAGAGHVIATGLRGEVMAWGRNNRGQLGLGDTRNRTRPAVVPGVRAIESIGVGDNTSYAIDENGALFVWGSNESGQLGDGTVTQRNAPVRLPGLPAMAQASGGAAMSVYLPSTAVIGPDPGPDVTPPSVPSNVVGQSFEVGVANVSWNGSRDDRTRYVTYLVYRDGGTTPVAEVGGVEYRDTGLVPGSTHTWRIRASDGTNLSEFSVRSPVLTVSDDPGTDPEVYAATDFSNGLAGVTGTNVTIDTSTGSTTNPPPSARIAVTASPAYGRLALPAAVSHVCLSADVRLSSLTGDGRYALLKLRDVDGGSLARLSIDRFGRLTVRNDVTGTLLFPNVVLAVGTWHRVRFCVEPYYSGLTYLLVDGASAGSWLSEGGGAGSVGSVQFGDNEARTVDVSFDDIVASR